MIDDFKSYDNYLEEKNNNRPLFNSYEIQFFNTKKNIHMLKSSLRIKKTKKALKFKIRTLIVFVTLSRNLELF